MKVIFGVSKTSYGDITVDIPDGELRKIEGMNYSAAKRRMNKICREALVNGAEIEWQPDCPSDDYPYPTAAPTGFWMRKE